MRPWGRLRGLPPPPPQLRWGGSCRPWWPCGHHLRRSRRHQPSRPRAPPRPRLGLRLRSPPRTVPCSRRRRPCGLLMGRLLMHAPGAPGGRAGGYCPSTSPTGSAAMARSGLRWWPGSPTPPHPRCALWAASSPSSSAMPPPHQLVPDNTDWARRDGPRLPPLCRVVPAPGSPRARGLPRMWLPGGAAPPPGGGAAAHVVPGVW